ncbi:MAG TPA: hypothetical protein PKY29_04460 [Ferruginibacter sp.]|nr:hypothetical protein [Ferruginibacter sp.]HRQ20541.1 hypothetical protein [Ferruginibacter sp.]
MKTSPKKIHYNKPQLRSMLVGAPVEYLVAGRGTGKSEGVLAPKTASCYFGTMPRSAGVAVGATYNQLLTRTLPALIAGWERLGYVMNHHYIIGRRPSDSWIKKWKWKGPFRPPLDYKYFISWWNGSGCHLVSQDRAGSANGITIDWIFGDELKLLNADKLKTELFPANRGVVLAFKGNPYHHGMTFTTDMPTGTSGRWILDMADKMDTDKVQKILNLQNVIFKLQQHASKSRKPVQHEVSKQIEIINLEINELRHNLLYYHEASTLENIHALGADYIRQQLRDTTPFQFDTQILNLKPMKLEDGFYPDFDEDYHGYFAVNNSYLEKLDYDFEALKSINCLRDSDVNPNAPLHVVLDYNRRIHPLVVLQDDGVEIKALKGIHTLYPQKLKECISAFNEYYAPHKRRLIYYWYDHTAIADDDAMTKAQEVVMYLRKAGWIVKEMYIGQAPGHEAKYRMWGHLLSEDGHYTNRRFRINRENCDKLITSICLTQSEQRKDGYGKNKKPEQDKNFPADEAPHYSDALDQAIWGMLELKLPYGKNEKLRDSIMGL